MSYDKSIELEQRPKWPRRIVLVSLRILLLETVHTRKIHKDNFQSLFVKSKDMTSNVTKPNGIFLLVLKPIHSIARHSVHAYWEFS